MKKKKCKVCGDEFTPMSFTQKACKYQCALVLTRIQQKNTQDKLQRKETKQARDKLKTKSAWLKEAQTAFNAYIRKRDEAEGCISCGTTNNVQFCAGHYFTRGAYPELRFSELNVHKQCNKRCNLELSGNIAAYRVNLLKKIGRENLDFLEGKHELQKLTIDDIKEIKQYYKEKIKLL